MSSADTEGEIRREGGGIIGAGCISAGLHDSLRRSLKIQIEEREKKTAEERLGRFGTQALVGACERLYITGRPRTPPPDHNVENSTSREPEHVETPVVKFSKPTTTFGDLASDSVVGEGFGGAVSGVPARHSSRRNKNVVDSATPGSSIVKRRSRDSRKFAGSLAEEEKKIFVPRMSEEQTEEALEGVINELKRQLISRKRRCKAEVNLEDTDDGEESRTGREDEDDADLSFMFSSVALTTSEAQVRGFNPYIL
ncbi:hypothetical protein NDN08_004621 [Rhodosorus marinus]|uniref:Uncharacterized protein n=1 Tax=Rhodosorus marinus TaxID=101924 RepID=A0AAV8ULR2_9RHOD|nr:hypothetical protein NDN08_004621 [Rhodosorus marinus]